MGSKPLTVTMSETATARGALNKVDYIHGLGDERRHGDRGGFGNKLLQAKEAGGGVAGMDRGHAAGVAGVPGFEKIQGGAVVTSPTSDARRR